MKTIMNYVYLNRAKVESFFSQLNGYVISEQKERRTKGVAGTGKVGAELGSILAKLGLAKGTAEMELGTDYSKMLEITTTLSIENKLAVVLAHFSDRKKVAEIDISTLSRSEPFYDKGNSEFQIVKGEFRIYIDELEPQTVINEIQKAWRLANDTYGILPFKSDSERDYFKLTYMMGELRSEINHPETNEPIVKVPIFLNNLSPNQIIIMFVYEPFSISVLGNSIVRPTYVVVNPIAIWL